MYTLYTYRADRVQTARAIWTSQCGSPQSTTTTSPTNLRAQNDWTSRDNSIAPPSRPSADPSAVHDQGADDGGTPRHEVFNHIDYQMQVRCAVRYRTSRTASGKMKRFITSPAVSANDNQLRLLLEHTEQKAHRTSARSTEAIVLQRSDELPRRESIVGVRVKGRALPERSENESDLTCTGLGERVG